MPFSRRDEESATVGLWRCRRFRRLTKGCRSRIGPAYRAIAMPERSNIHRGLQLVVTKISVGLCSQSLWRLCRHDLRSPPSISYSMGVMLAIYRIRRRNGTLHGIAAGSITGIFLHQAEALLLLPSITRIQYQKLRLPTQNRSYRTCLP